MKEFVFPTVDDLNEGCGVLVGNLFATAAHADQGHVFFCLLSRSLPFDDFFYFFFSCLLMLLF